MTCFGSGTPRVTLLWVRDALNDPALSQAGVEWLPASGQAFLEWPLALGPRDASGDVALGQGSLG